jgi:phosphotriesterase-related protein
MSSSQTRSPKENAVASDLKGKVMTVTGAVQPAELGVTHPHEHVIIDFLVVGEAAQESHQMAFADATGGKNQWDEPLSLANYYEARRNPFLFKAALQLTNEEDAVQALKEFKDAGGGTIVDLTPIGVGRAPDVLRRVSERSGVKIVMGSGYYVVDFHPAEIADFDEGAIYDSIIRDLEQGAGESGARPGIIGEIGLVWPIHDRERTVLRAAARAQADTGYCLTIHPGRDTACPLEAIKIVEQAGGDPSRTIMDHLDRTLFEMDDLLALAKTGCYLEFDLFGLESSYYPVAELDMPNDHTRAEKLAALAEHGYLEKLLISEDIDTTTRLRANGGEGYHHILANVLPIMRRKGFSDADIQTIMETNPQRALTII